jgi:hypothetical protein
MHMKWRIAIVGSLTLGLALLRGLAAQAAEGWKLDNGVLSASFDRKGLVKLTDAALKQDLDFTADHAVVQLDGVKLDTAGVEPRDVRRRGESLTYSYEINGRKLWVVYELKPAWRFLSKQVRMGFPSGFAGRIDSVEVLQGMLSNKVEKVEPIRGGRYGVFLRLAPPSTDGPRMAFFAVVQNPFMKWIQPGQEAAAAPPQERRRRASPPPPPPPLVRTDAGMPLQIAYTPEMEWKAEYGPFESDRACIGPYALSGVEFPIMAAREWEYNQDPEKAVADAPARLDQNEIAAMTDCVRAFLMVRPKKSVRVHVGWCENDYQIDVGTPEGVAEYKRIIDQVSALGFDHLLYGPGNKQVSSLEENRDAWGWENVLWLGMGQKVRKSEWDPEKDSLPASVQEMVDYAKSKKVTFLAYVYPSLGFMQDLEWTRWCDNRPGTYSGADTGIRSFQDWLVRKLVAFSKKSGNCGFSFDHWWINYRGGATSTYAQWYGCRRILSELRRRLPDVVVDGRQQYYGFGPWTWVAGTYPHPMMSDEQPGSYRNFPDLHFDRVSADRQRFAAWMYRVGNFCPVEILPGFMTHQTYRSDKEGKMRRDRCRPRDWDYLGWKYSVISSLGVAPVNHVLNMIPARDEEEMKAFSKEDIAWLRKWVSFTDRNMEYMLRMRAIIGQPMIGRVDGTSAIIEDRGFIFLFNPNYRRLEAEFTLDQSIGLANGSNLVLKELYPVEGRLHGKPGAGPWNYGDRVKLAIKGPEAMVLRIEPAGSLAKPMLFGAAGEVSIKGGRLELAKVTGEPGAALSLTVLTPKGKAVSGVSVNGKAARFTQAGNIVNVPVRFKGTPFGHCQQAGEYDPVFNGESYAAEFTVPKRVFEQLEARKKAWPVPTTEEELAATWMAPHRLLLFVQIADPRPDMPVSLKMDGQPVELRKAYGGVYPNSGRGTFVGFYTDLSSLTPDQQHKIEVTLPESLQPGQFQGVFFENVEASWTTELAD